MIDISVIIVNYNVKHFLRQCIESIVASTRNLSVEIIVVDNASVDGSQQMLESEFTEVQLINNVNNVGFAAANNQGVAIAQGNYVLLLNPDTIIEEQTLTECYQYAEQHQMVGAIGVKMVDGSGHYLPESKRGFPTTSAAFYKITGIYRLFQTSATFNAYYAGHLDKDDTGVVDVLCGAYMFIPREVYLEVGGLDEDYFMYGEDIDLSYCIQQAGYNIVYLPTTQIIHYKGESTKKSSKKYHTAFYGAMQIFLQKHFTGRNSQITLWFLKAAVVVVGLMATIKNTGKKFLSAAVDWLLSIGLIAMIKPLWAQFYHNDIGYFDQSSYRYWIAGIVTCLIALLYLIGHYDKDAKRSRFIPTIIVYGLIVLGIYSLSPEGVRFSRVLVVSSVIVPGWIVYLTRVIRNWLRYRMLRYEVDRQRRITIVGERSSVESIETLLSQIDGTVVVRVQPDFQEFDQQYYMSNLNQIGDAITVMESNEIIFCSKDISMEEVFQLMSKLGSRINYRIASQSNLAVLGSDSKDSSGKWYTEEVSFDINTLSNIRMKRLFDAMVGLISIGLSPYLLIRSGSTRKLVKNIFNLLLGLKTVFGYDQSEDLPNLKSSVIQVDDIETQSDNQGQNPSIQYARNYSVWQDVTLWLNLIIYG